MTVKLEPKYKKVIDNVATGNAMREARVALNIRQKDLARYLHYTEGLVNAFEKGEYEISEEEVKKWSAAMQKIVDMCS